MIICGLKLTHDAGVALIDKGRLIFSIELEKVNNNPRYCNFSKKLEYVEILLNEFGYTSSDVDSFVIDGWNDSYKSIQFFNNKPVKFNYNSYDPITSGQPLLYRQSFKLDNCLFSEYGSYQHISGHIVGSYSTSKFASNNQSSFIMVWDGAIGAQLYYFDSFKAKFQNLGWVHYLYGACYAEFANKFEPFSQYNLYDMSVPGKLMAYIGSGVVKLDLLKQFEKIYYQLRDRKAFDNNCRSFSKEFQALAYQVSRDNFVSEDILATYHEFLGYITVIELMNVIERYPNHERNLCYSGGCALNIKWNSAIRSSNAFIEMWIPPFPNDSGSAIGAACCEMINVEKRLHLEWETYSGPALVKNEIHYDGWDNILCPLGILANLIYTTNEPVVFLNERAELGPRSLGNRSILASPINSGMKTKLNSIKLRESYRPVAPVCLEQFADYYFNPGICDPLMLFDHMVKEDKRDKVPAVVHIDGTARVQTVNKEQNATLFELLTVFYELSGVPILCNTSANMNGKGFFPDIKSAIEWGKCDMIWSEGKLFFKKSSPFYNVINSYKKEFIDNL